MTWRIQLVQRTPGEIDRYFTGSVLPQWRHGLTAHLKHAATYDTQKSAEAAVSNLPKHDWGKWEVVEII